jgi:hypothetical protein
VAFEPPCTPFDKNWVSRLRTVEKGREAALCCLTRRKETAMPHIQETFVLPENAQDELEDLLVRFEEVERDQGDTTRIEERIWTIEALLDAARDTQPAA